MKTALFTLPLPPSVNALYSTNFATKRRFISKRYEGWLGDATLTLLQQPRQPKFDGAVALSLYLGRPDKRKRDASNMIKPIEDFLVKQKIIKDDSLIDDLRVKWTADHPGMVTVKITEILDLTLGGIL